MEEEEFTSQARVFREEFTVVHDRSRAIVYDSLQFTIGCYETGDVSKVRMSS